MARKTIKINPERGKRLNQWLKHIEMTQLVLADKTGYSQQLISGIITGKKNLTFDAAKLISEKTQGKEIVGGVEKVRPEWLMCLDDYMTHQEMFHSKETIIDNAIHAVDILISEILEKHGYCKDTLNEDATFTLVKGDKTIRIPYSDFRSLRKEIKHYSEYVTEIFITEILDNTLPLQ
jgi:transcriptional regulator with XRE-family HTH domain